jgi:hypothetical protein
MLRKRNGDVRLARFSSAQTGGDNFDLRLTFPFELGARHDRFD